MVNKDYVPERGEIVWLDFDPQTGREQAGRRPALVITDSRYHRITRRGLFCPITSKVKGYPMEVLVSTGNIRGAILADHVKNLDWQARHAESSGTMVDAEIMNTVRAHLAALIGI